MFAIKVQLTRGKEKAVGYDNLVLTPNALWKIKGLLEAAGVEVPEGEMEIEEKDLVGLEFDAEVVNENFEGKDRPKLVSFRPLSDDEESDDEDDEEEEEDEDDEDEEEEEAPKSKKKASKKSKAKDDDEDEEEDEDDEDDDSDDEDDEEESDDDEDDEDDEEEDDEDEEDEDEKPKKKAKGKKSAPKLRAGQKVTFTDDKDKTRKGVITSIDDDTIFVEDSKGEEWELSADEIEVSK